MPRIRAAFTARPNCSANGLPPMRRGRYVLRVETLFGVASGHRDKGSVSAIVNTLRQGGTPRIFEDRTVSPTSVFDAARATTELLERRAAPGLYHCVNSGHGTWLELATEAARILKVPARFETVRFADVKLPAARPMVLRARQSQDDVARHPDADLAKRARPLHRKPAIARHHLAGGAATISPTSCPTARHEVNPGESMPEAWMTRRVALVAPDQEIRDDSDGG